MHVALDRTHLSSRADGLEACARDMTARREALADAVEALLGRWHGDAASRFDGLWQEWCGSADAVAAMLSAGIAALRHARDDVVVADDAAVESSDRLRGRLG